MTWLDDVEMTNVIVNTTDGQAYRGLKSSVYDDCIVLSGASLLGDAELALHGDQLIPRANVTGIQLVAGAA